MLYIYLVCLIDILYNILWWGYYKIIIKLSSRIYLYHLYLNKLINRWHYISYSVQTTTMNRGNSNSSTNKWLARSTYWKTKIDIYHVVPAFFFINHTLIEGKKPQKFVDSYQIKHLRKRNFPIKEVKMLFFSFHYWVIFIVYTHFNYKANLS